MIRVIKYTKYEIKYCKNNKDVVSSGITNEDALVVCIVRTKNEPQINHGHCKTQHGQSEEIYKYKGKVYCLEVSSHVFMIRQNNKNVWIGNCSRHK